jgi:hypothetical protein
MPFRDLSTLPPCDWPQDDDPSPTLVPDDDGLAYAIGHESSQIGQDRDVAGVTSRIVPRRTFHTADRLSALTSTARALLQDIGATRHGLQQLAQAREQIEAAETLVAEALLVAGPVAWGTYEEVSADLASREPMPGENNPEVADALTSTGGGGFSPAVPTDPRTDAVVLAERDPTPEPAPPRRYAAMMAAMGPVPPGLLAWSSEYAAKHQHWAQREDWRQDGDQRTATQRCGCGAVRVVTWPRYSPGCEPLAVGAWTGQAPPALGQAPEDGDYYYVSDHGGPVVTTLAGLDLLARRDCDRHAAATETAPRWRDAHEVG